MGTYTLYTNKIIQWVWSSYKSIKYLFNKRLKAGTQSKDFNWSGKEFQKTGPKYEGDFCVRVNLW